MRVERDHEQPIAEGREAAVHQAAADLQAFWQLALVVPDLPAGAPVDRPGVIERAGDVEHAVDHERRRLELVDDAGLKRPLRGQLIDVRGVICVSGLNRWPV